MGYTSNIPSISKRMARIPDHVRACVRKVVVRTIIRLDEGVHEKTPVWSGLAIRNMIWSEGRPNTREFPAIEMGSVENEGRRSANEAAARQTRDALLQNIKPFGIYFLSNASKHIFELEAGQLPSPERSRVPPGGMFGLTYAEVRSSIGV